MTPIRYMKLSTPLLLLADRVFLLSLRCLQSDDKFEGLMPQRVSIRSPYGKALYPRIEQFESWLLQQAKSNAQANIDAMGSFSTAKFAKFPKIYDRQICKI